MKTAKAAGHVAPDDAGDHAYCTDVLHLAMPASRKLIGRHLANFLDGLVITPTELVHSAKYQKRLGDAGRTLMDALDKISTVQARGAQVPPALRLRELDGLVTAAIKKVWDDEKERPVPAVPAENFMASVARITATGVEREYAIGRLLTEHLFQRKLWKEKIAALVRLMAIAEGSDVQPLVELPLAECLRSEAALDQMLGFSERLENRCDDLVMLWQGKWEARETAAAEMADIARMIADGEAPDVKAAVEHALMRSLAAKMPLRSAEPEEEIQAVFDLFRRIWVDGNLIGGTKTLTSLERRQARHINNETVTDLLRERKVLADRVAFLMVLAGTAVGQNNRATLKIFIDHYFGDQDFIPRIISGHDAPVPKLQTLTQIHRAIRASWLSDEEKGTYAAKVEAAQAELIKRSRLFEQISKKGGGPAQKVLTLLDLARKNTFIDGPVLEGVKKAIVGYLQDPQFIPDYLGANQGEDRERKVELLSRTLASFGIRWGA